MDQLAWGLKVSSQFRDNVFDIVERFSWDWPTAADELMACMAFETGETFSPSVKNMAGSGATGLIQFMPKTAIGLGTSVDELAKMSAEEQLEVVFEYFQPYYRRIKGLPDMYMAILLPKYVGKPDASVLFTRGTTAYRQNGPLDADNDGNITKREACAKVEAKLRKGLGPAYLWSRP